MAGKRFDLRRWEWDGPHKLESGISPEQIRAAGPEAWLQARAHHECPGAGAGYPPLPDVQQCELLRFEPASNSLPRLGCSKIEIPQALFFATAKFYVEADNAILVTNGNNGDVARQIVFRTDNLLRSLRHIRGVS